MEEPVQMRYESEVIKAEIAKLAATIHLREADVIGRARESIS